MHSKCKSVILFHWTLVVSLNVKFVSASYEPTAYVSMPNSHNEKDLELSITDDHIASFVEALRSVPDDVYDHPTIITSVDKDTIHKPIAYQEYSRPQRPQFYGLSSPYISQEKRYELASPYSEAGPQLPRSRDNSYHLSHQSGQQYGGHSETPGQYDDPADKYEAQRMNFKYDKLKQVLFSGDNYPDNDAHYNDDANDDQYTDKGHEYQNEAKTVSNYGGDNSYNGQGTQEDTSSNSNYINDNQKSKNRYQLHSPVSPQNNVLDQNIANYSSDKNHFHINFVHEILSKVVKQLEGLQNQASSHSNGYNKQQSNYNDDYKTDEGGSYGHTNANSDYNSNNNNNYQQQQLAPEVTSPVQQAVSKPQTTGANYEPQEPPQSAPYQLQVLSQTQTKRGVSTIILPIKAQTFYTVPVINTGSRHMRHAYPDRDLGSIATRSPKISIQYLPLHSKLLSKLVPAQSPILAYAVPVHQAHNNLYKPCDHHHK